MRSVAVLLGGAALAASVAATSTPAQPAPARKPPVPAAKLFPYLDRYLKLPAAERTLFAPAYLLLRDHKPARDLKVWLVDGATREPIPIGADGRMERLPTLAQLASAKVDIDVPAATRLGLTLTFAATLRPAAEMSAADLTRAIRQADAGAHKAAGMMAMMLPKLDRANFPGAGGGQAVGAGGAATPLPSGAAPYADLALLAKATTVKLSRAPSFVQIDGAPKK